MIFKTSQASFWSFFIKHLSFLLVFLMTLIMCGIAGFYSTKKKVSSDEMKKMTGMLAHRGPDAEGFFLEDNVGLGHKRLSIIDLSTQANQPMVSHSGRYIIVYNGIICSTFIKSTTHTSIRLIRNFNTIFYYCTIE